MSIDDKIRVTVGSLLLIVAMTIAAGYFFGPIGSVLASLVGLSFLFLGWTVIPKYVDRRRKRLKYIQEVHCTSRD